MTQTTFQVNKRAAVKPKQLRRKGIVPGNIFGDGDSLAVQMDGREFKRLYEDVGETGLIYLRVDESNKQHPVLIDEVQLDPVSAEILHATFKQVDLAETIFAEVPIEVIGVFDLPEAVMMVVKDEIEVEALPTDLPEKFEVDVSVLKEIGQMIAYKDLKYDKNKVKLILGEEGEEEPIVLVQEQREEEPEETPIEEPVEGEEGAIEGKQPEGEAEKTGEEKSDGGKTEPAADKKPESQPKG